MMTIKMRIELQLAPQPCAPERQCCAAAALDRQVVEHRQQISSRVGVLTIFKHSTYRCNVTPAAARLQAPSHL